MPLIRYDEPSTPAPLTGTTPDGILIHACAEAMPQLPPARFVRMPQTGDIYALECDFPSDGRPGRVLVSRDEGQTWQPTAPIGGDLGLIPTDSGAITVTSEGTLIVAFANYGEMQRPGEWDPAHKGDLGWREPTWVARSLDQGRTWQDCQRLHEAWTGAVRDMIQTRDGRIVFTTMKLCSDPGRHAVLTYSSDDDGQSWSASNLLDLGGNGHHGGISEPTLIECRDGRLMMLIRTNWGQFWRAFSEDGGRHWHPYGPAGIDASSAPGALLRLHDGRIALVWNREYPEGCKSVDLRGGDGIWSATPASNFRRELSLSFSNDEGETWTPPIVVARNPERETSYPYLFEPEPGLLWITACRLKDVLLKMSLRIDALERSSQ